MLRGDREPTSNTLPIDDSYSPVLHRLDSAIRYRAIHPNDPVPPASERLTKFSRPPEDLVEKSKKYLERLIDASDVKKGTTQLPPKYIVFINRKLQFRPKQRAVNVLRKLKNRFLVLTSTHYSIKKNAPRYLSTTRYRNSSRFWAVQRISKL